MEFHERFVGTRGLDVKKVIFVCAENACRSQMAQAFYSSHAKNSRADSAGTFPAATINPLAIRVMAELGIDISRNTPGKFDLSSLDRYERIISFGCVAKAAFPDPEKFEEWLIEDPAGKDLDFFRSIRDEIQRRVKRLVAEVDG